MFVKEAFHCFAENFIKNQSKLLKALEYNKKRTAAVFI